ncbi:uncharacterized protein [Setaria viridis]|uniref:uncharacterized protein n=1 Tax=Setaria viridis TaxID=4556 RepID=UPI003B3A47ED
MKLTGMMAALSRFINKLGKKGLPFFELLKKMNKFEWDDEASKLLEELKAFLTTPPIIMAKNDQEMLELYISTTTHVVSTVLVAEHEDPNHAHMVQRPVYYVSEVLSDSKIHYKATNNGAGYEALIHGLRIVSLRIKHILAYDDSNVIIKQLDMFGSFKTALGGYTHIFVAVDKFNKWIKVKAVTSIELAKAAQFIEEITHHFGVPNRIITDLGKQFTGSEFLEFCHDNLIDVYYSSVAHPRCNG